MPRPKARYNGDGFWTVHKDYSDVLREKLREYYPDQHAESDPSFGHPADEFVSHILEEAKWAVSELHWQRLDITKPEIRAEHLDVMSIVLDCHNKLRNLSRGYERLLPVDAALWG